MGRFKSVVKPDSGKQDFWYVKQEHKPSSGVRREVQAVRNNGFRTNAVTARQLDLAVDEIRPMDRLRHEPLTKRGIKNYYVRKR